MAVYLGHTRRKQLRTAIGPSGAKTWLSRDAILEGNSLGQASYHQEPSLVSAEMKQLKPSISSPSMVSSIPA